MSKIRASDEIKALKDLHRDRMLNSPDKQLILRNDLPEALVGASFKESLGILRNNFLYTLTPKPSERCQICLVDFGGDALISVLGCNERHFCHQDCLNQWITANKANSVAACCPICREPINSQKISQKGFTEIDQIISTRPNVEVDREEEIQEENIEMETW